MVKFPSTTTTAAAYYCLISAGAVASSTTCEYIGSGFCKADGGFGSSQANEGKEIGLFGITCDVKTKCIDENEKDDFFQQCASWCERAPMKTQGCDTVPLCAGFETWFGTAEESVAATLATSHSGVVPATPDCQIGQIVASCHFIPGTVTTTTCGTACESLKGGYMDWCNEDDMRSDIVEEVVWNVRSLDKREFACGPITGTLLEEAAVPGDTTCYSCTSEEGGRRDLLSFEKDFGSGYLRTPTDFGSDSLLTPTATPTASPSSSPSASPSSSPTASPTASPTSSPTCRSLGQGYCKGEHRNDDNKYLGKFGLTCNIETQCIDPDDKEAFFQECGNICDHRAPPGIHNCEEYKSCVGYETFFEYGDCEDGKVVAKCYLIPETPHECDDCHPPRDEMNWCDAGTLRLDEIQYSVAKSPVWTGVGSSYTNACGDVVGTLFKNTLNTECYVCSDEYANEE